MSDTITIVGNLAADPETRASGAITTFRVGSTQRRLDKESGKWVDAHTSWYNVSAFRQLGAHALQSLRRGQRVIVTGRLKIRDWENSAGKGRSADIEADAIGHDLLWGTTEFRRDGDGADRTGTPVTEWSVQALGDQAAPDAWSTPGITSAQPSGELVPVTVPAVEPVLTPAAPMREPDYGGDDAPF